MRSDLIFMTRLFRFYFIRHGRTDANAQGKMCGGDWDIPLNGEGEQQAHAAAQKFLSLPKEDRPEFICSSPMMRARQTGEAISSVLKMPMKVVEELREWRVGDWEGKPWGEVPDPFTTTEDPNNGETRREFEERVIRGASKALEEDGPVLIVGHGAVWHALTKPLGIDPGNIPNATPVLIELMLNGLAAKWTAKAP